MIIKLGPYAKTVAALVVGILGWATQVITSAPGPVTATEWLAFGTVFATAVGVYGVTNQAAA